MIQASLGSDNQAYFVATECIYSLSIQIHRQYNYAYISIRIFGRLEKVYFSLKNTPFDDFRGMEGSFIILVVPGGNKKVICILYDRKSRGV
jgi:hypothetical protein